ncbi:hypothetical protein Plav_0869 [Parvibaculum lavamentivorans DS-1]|uniref:Uncharacterized protein n=1 Tax=Parvibaculum lavamentivorans (strain DS-1 / DSM 13023 / NCIMB 13966) TaxID=402881 RepID=A7HRF9_PARL1|nr:hypothetical protein [Parvibaculum lavamentivorans]ABS62492.1 hypothetical protein Plav_0869 [Parvibaculum lavamentivorans DS-1]
MRDDALPNDIDYSRAAYDVLLGLDAAARAAVGEVAADGARGREIAPGMFSAEAVPGLRVVLRRAPGATTILALTGEVAASRGTRGRQAS